MTKTMRIIGMIQEDLFRKNMTILNACIDANLPPEKVDVFYAVISPRMTTEGFLSAVEKLITGEVKVFGSLKTSDIISACDEYKTMAEKTKILIERSRYGAVQIYDQTESPEYEKIIIKLYGSREKFEEWKEEIKGRDETVEYCRKEHKENFLEAARKIITEESFKEYGIESLETQGLLI